MLHLHEGPDQGYTSDRLEKRREISPTLGGIQTHDLSVKRRVFYRCATTTAWVLFILRIVPNCNKLDSGKNLVPNNLLF